jgi:hypothetical protein
MAANTTANTTSKNATTAPTTLLASTTPGITGGMVAAEQAGGGDSSRGESRATLQPGMWRYTDATGTRIGQLPADVWAFVERADAKFGIVEDSARWAEIVGKQRKGK